jgi:hypothetical protein
VTTSLIEHFASLEDPRINRLKFMYNGDPLTVRAYKHYRINPVTFVTKIL